MEKLIAKNNQKSEALFKEASQHLVGGVNSPVRSFKAVGGTPLFIEKARGAFITDVDGNDYIDFVASPPVHLAPCAPHLQQLGALRPVRRYFARWP